MLSHYVNIYLALKFVSFFKIMALIEVPLEILDRPTIGKVFLEMFLYLGPVWIAFLVGVLVGWAWKPRWVISKFNGKFNICSPPATISSSVEVARDGSDNDQIDNPFSEDSAIGSSQLESDKSLAVSDEDLKHLYDLVERKDGGTPWKHMMENSTHNMSYQAWQRVPETGPPQYRSRTVYEDATPELLRDFFWDDEFRSKWNNMIIHADIIEECPTTGTMVVHWVRKFPFFCSDREYIIGRRIWESGRSYYCVTKGVSNDSIPRQDKPRRVDLYYSSWFIRAVESRNGNGQLSACELILFHYEDMGIPWEIAKYGVRQGMWGAVKKVERGFRLYQKERSSVGPVSRCAFLASINTKVNPGFLESLENDEDTEESETDGSVDKPGGLNIHQALVFGGAVALAFSLNRGLLTKALILGVAIRFGNIGRR